MVLNHLIPCTEKEIQQYLNVRPGEQKLGETILLPGDFAGAAQALRKFNGRYVIVGIPEDLGPRANYGKGGSHTAYQDFLKSFVNIQENRTITGNDILLLGTVETNDLLKKSAKATVPQLRKLVEELDQRVYPIIRAIVLCGKIPVVIGGGHNNSFPIIKGISLELNKPLNILNIDPHADMRVLEGRHSGNGFSYALADGYLEKYFVFGLHENYNNEYTLNVLHSDKHLFGYITYEYLLDKGFRSKKMADEVANFFHDADIGVEIDLDAFQYAPSSARTPVGFRPDQIRKFIRRIFKRNSPRYLHVSEGIADDMFLTGKLISYIVSDFIRCTGK